MNTFMKEIGERERKNPLCVLHEDKLSLRKNKAAQKINSIQI